MSNPALRCRALLLPRSRDLRREFALWILATTHDYLDPGLRAQCEHWIHFAVFGSIKREIHSPDNLSHHEPRLNLGRPHADALTRSGSERQISESFGTGC